MCRPEGLDYLGIKAALSVYVPVAQIGYDDQMYLKQ